MEIIDVDNYIAIQTCNPLFMDINTLDVITVGRESIAFTFGNLREEFGDPEKTWFIGAMFNKDMYDVKSAREYMDQHGVLYLPVKEALEEESPFITDWIFYTSEYRGSMLFAIYEKDTIETSIRQQVEYQIDVIERNLKEAEKNIERLEGYINILNVYADEFKQFISGSENIRKYDTTQRIDDIDS